MPSYYKIYHYGKPELTEIDPAFYGTRISGQSELKHGAAGVNKSFFYTVDMPETIVGQDAQRYEMYLPLEWKNQLYDYHADPKHYWETAKQQLLKGRDSVQRPLVEHEIRLAFETLVRDRGYKGFTYKTDSDLSTVGNRSLTLFYKLPTGRPQGSYTAFAFETGKQLEGTTPSLISAFMNYSFLKVWSLYKTVKKQPEEPLSRAGKKPGLKPNPSPSS